MRWLLASGCAGAKPTPDAALEETARELRESVASNIPDHNRKEQMLALVDQIESNQSDFSAVALEFVGKFRKLNTNYDAPRASFDELFSEFQVQRIQSRDRILDLHFRFAALATADEWARIGRVEAKIYDELVIARARQAGTT
ncbi:MAG: hypothetical protein ABI616_01275 [Pseudomonadota bacterium]